jgi:twitching motility two-component system response regulator PilH
MPDCAVLVVEDDQDSREAMIDVLRFEGYDARGAENGRDALELLRSGSFNADVILVDLFMPTMDGRDFERTLHEDARFADIPVIVCTGDPTKPIPGAFASLQKPFDIDALISIVRRGCGARRISA